MALLRIVLALVMTVARLVPFLLVALLLLLVWRLAARKRKEPDFKGPVVTVDYTEVKDEDGGKEDP